MGLKAIVALISAVPFLFGGLPGIKGLSSISGLVGTDGGALPANALTDDSDVPLLDNSDVQLLDDS